MGDWEGDDGEGGNGVDQMGRGATGWVRWGGGQWGGGNRKGETGKLANGRGRRRGTRRRGFHRWIEMLGWTYGMPGWNEIMEFFDCLPVQRRVPQLVYTNKTGDCLSVCLSVCLFICSAMGGQTARPNGLKFGG